ncbi:L,D-transpeptidase family protein [Pedobacter polaris]|nr:L,D-transpeptidase family protein [Pedobacter polaris]
MEPIEKVKSKILLQNAKEDPGIKWHDSLYKHLPKGIDTSIVVNDSKENPFKFAQYVKLVFNHKAIIFRDKKVWRLHRLTEDSQDSLQKDDYAVASRERWDAWRYPDTITSWKVKLEDIANTLAQADHILVLKAKHKMIITRKGKVVKTFNIDMGFNPIGNKVKEGDGKTPEGIYNVDHKYIRRDKFYKSFLISYPDANDKSIAKQRGVKAGYGVSIHGTTPAKVNAKDWTAGCIALQNKDIDTLFKYIASGTVIEIRK